MVNITNKFKRRIGRIIKSPSSRVNHQKITYQQQASPKEPSLKQIRKEIKQAKQIEIKQARGRIIEQEIKRRRSLSGRIGGLFERGVKFAQRGATRSLYQKQIQRQQKVNQAMNYGRQKRSNRIVTTRSFGVRKRGRPVKSFDPRYQKYGGVYGYRKYLAQQRWKERQQILEQSAASPRQRMILDQIRQREQMQRQSSEAQIIPDTQGNIPTMRTIHQEINDYANLID